MQTPRNISLYISLMRMPTDEHLPLHNSECRANDDENLGRTLI